MTDWNDSGSVLKFQGTHRRHGGEGLRAPASPALGSAPPPPAAGSATSLEPTPRAARGSGKRRAPGAGLAHRPWPRRVPALPAPTSRAQRSHRSSDAPAALPQHALLKVPSSTAFILWSPEANQDPRRQPPAPSGRPSAALRVSTFRRRASPRFCQPQTCPGTCPRRAWQARTQPSPRAQPPPPSLLPLPPSLAAPVRIATGGSAGRLPPPIHLFPMTLAGLEHSEPAPAGSRTRLCARWGARGRAPKPPTPWIHLSPSARGSPPRLAQGSRPTTNEKGNGPARPGQGAVTRSYLRAPAAWAPRGRGSSPLTTRRAPGGASLPRA